MATTPSRPTPDSPWETLERILLRCWLIGLAFLLIWLGAFFTHVIHQLHGPLFGLSDHELNVIHYCGFAVFKLLVLTCFFIPWVAVRLVLGPRR